MPKLFCIPRQFIEGIKKELDMEKLYGMTSAERREFFQKHTNKDVGKSLNTEFERAMASPQEDALLTWVKKNFSGAEQKSAIEKIKKNEDLLSAEDDAFLEDLVSSKYGVDIKPEEAKIVLEQASKIESLEKELGENVDNPDFAEKNAEYYKSISDMDEYFDTLRPSNKLDVATGVTARANLLTSVKSPIVNIENNAVTGLFEAFRRRLTNKRVSGFNGDLARKYVGMVRKVYQASGFDPSRMLSFEEGASTQGRKLGEEISKPKSRLLTAYSSLVFKHMMGYPDTIASAISFADSANLASSRMAVNDFKLRGKEAQDKSREMMLDAMRVQPKTIEGELIRSQALADAQYSTMTQSRKVSSTLLKFREGLDRLSGPLKLGTISDPFVKVPANAVLNSLDFSGATSAFDVLKLFGEVNKNGWKGVKNDKEFIRNITSNLLRAGMGFGAAYWIASYIKPDDFMGAYDPNRYKIDQLKDGSYNSVKIGDKWISLDYFGPLAAPLVGILYAKKYGDGTLKNMALQYGNGLVTQLGRLPVIGTVSDTLGEYANMTEKDISKFLQKKATDFEGGIGDFIAQRSVPAILGDIAQGLDKFQRDTKTGVYNMFGKNFDSFINKIPGVRENLPKKTNLLGRDMQGEGFINSVFFGNRVNIDKSGPAEQEVFRLTNGGNKPSITDFSHSSSEKVAQIKQKLSKEDFKKASDDYGKTVAEAVTKLLNDKNYKQATDEEKAKTISEIASSYIETVAKKYNVGIKKTKRQNTNAYADKYKGR